MARWLTILGAVLVVRGAALALADAAGARPAAGRHPDRARAFSRSTCRSPPRSWSACCCRWSSRGSTA